MKKEKKIIDEWYLPNGELLFIEAYVSKVFYSWPYLELIEREPHIKSAFAERFKREFIASSDSQRLTTRYREEFGGESTTMFFYEDTPFLRISTYPTPNRDKQTFELTTRYEYLH